MKNEMCCMSETICSLFVRLISHQPAILFSQNEPATSNQPQPASSTLLSEQTSTSHQPPATSQPNRLLNCTISINFPRMKIECSVGRGIGLPPIQLVLGLVKGQEQFIYLPTEHQPV
jgi:hypothetical protein